VSYFKRVLLILLFFIILVVITSLFLPPSFLLERKVIVDADVEQVFKQVSDLKNWKNWSAWAKKDPQIYLDKSNYSSPSDIEGASFKWDSNNDDIGAGSITIIKLIANEQIENKVDFGMAESLNNFNFKEVEEGVEVVWAIKIDFGFNPISKFYGLFLEDKISPDIELGLQQLKTFTEDLPKIHRVEVKTAVIDKAQFYLSIRDTISQQEMNNIHGKVYAQINQFMDENNIVSNEPPLVIYHFWSDTLIDIELGIPVQDSIFIPSTLIKLEKIKPGNIVTAIHYGAYERLPETYFGINEWMRKNKVVVTGPPWESYITDPSAESNPEKWQTAVFFPIE
jgi:effector-binding domain-containing protein